MRKDEIKDESQLQLRCNSKPQSIAFKPYSQGILTCLFALPPLQYLLMLFPRSRRTCATFTAGALALLFTIAPSPSLRAQSPPAANGASQPAAHTVSKNAKQAYSEGLRAESAGDWQIAFEAYREAAALSPNDRVIQAHAEFARSALAQERTEQAEKQAVSGNLALARAMLQSAIQLDPTYTVAQERLQQLAQATAPAHPSSDPLAGLQATLPKLNPATGARNFDFNGPTRGAYEEIARQFGLTAAFDPELQDRQIRFRVSGIDFDTAMRLLGEQTETFWFAVDSKTFFVAADTPNKRHDYDPEINKTILLPASETNDEMTEALRMVRDIVGLRRTELDTKTHTITIRDTPQNVALAEAILDDVQKTPGEFLLEVDLLELDRNAELNLGISPPTSAKTFSLSTGVLQQLQQAQNSGTLLQAIQNIFGSQNPLAASAGAAAAIPPLIAFGGGNTLFLATLPGASATAAKTLSMLQRAQRVLLRVEDARPATFFVGEHYPITLALLSNSLLGPVSQLSAASITGAVSFPRTDYPVGHTPNSIAVADFNADGKLDLAVANQGDDTVSLLLGNGDGTFQSQTTLPSGIGPDAIVTADFNRDGKPDLAVANFNDNSISILLGNGDGTFSAGSTITGLKSPVALLAADLNADGLLDLVVLDQTDGQVIVLEGNGDGTFGTRTTTSVGLSPSALVSADFNADGKVDLAVTNSGSNSVSILLGAGNAGFFRRIDVGTGIGPSAIATADFDQNGTIDLAVTNKVDNTLSIFPGNGNGTFGIATNLATDSGPTALLEGNFNSDGFPDLIAICQSSSTIDIFLGVGGGTFSPAISVATGTGPVAAASSDFNGDTLQDLAVVDQSANTVSVILNSANPLGSLSSPSTLYPGSEYVDIGLKVHATPRVHPDGEVTLNMQFDITALSGQNVNGIPILSNRTIDQEVRLRANETSILSGLIENSEIRSITGWPGLGFLGPLTGLHDKQQSESELVIAITPRNLRLAPRVDRSFYAGRGVGTAAPPEIPAPGPPQPAGLRAPGAIQPGQPGTQPGPPPGFVPSGAAPGAVPAVPGAPVTNPGNPVAQPPGVNAGPSELNTQPAQPQPGPPPSER
jgi:type II secretory pathway component GspD/PulD (secretin)